MADIAIAGQRAAAAVAKKQRERKALLLRRGGASYRDIADVLGVTVKTAHGDVQRALSRVAALTAAEATRFTTLELERLDGLHFALWKAATGQVPDVAAAREVRKISESRRKLLGIDAPTEIKLTQDDFRKFGLAVLEAVGDEITDVEQRIRIARRVSEILGRQAPQAIAQLVSA